VTASASSACCGQQGQMLFLVRRPSLRPPEHEPGGSPRREVAVLGFRDERERGHGWGRLAGCQPLRLPETLGIARHGGIAPPVALLLEETKHLPGVMTALVPVLEEERFIGFPGTSEKFRTPDPYRLCK
jgi:hypothetical protein